MKYSKVFGPSTTTADTKGQIGSTYNMRPGGPFTITEARISGAGLTDAKAASGILHIEASGTDGPFEYAFGAGAGGAATVNGKHSEKVRTQIPIASGAELKAYLTTAEVLTDCLVELVFENGSKQAVRSYVSTFGDLSADTLATKTMPAIIKAGAIIQIRVGAGNVVNAKAAGIKVSLRVAGNDGPFDYAMFSGSGGATNSGQMDAEVRDINVPVTQNQIVYVDLTAVEATKDSVVSLAVA